jgi:NADH/NAD ratio-sensing transcriptional regulator Rex
VQDLAYFGTFGHGIGYRVEDLIIEASWARIGWNVLVGAGTSVSAATYGGFIRKVSDRRHFRQRPAKVGHRISGGSAEILPMSRLAGVIREHGVKMGILTVPQGGPAGGRRPGRQHPGI